MSKSSFMLDIKLLGPDEWLTLRDIRLSALRDSPRSFLSTYDLEEAYDGTRWQAEFTRGDWHVGVQAGEAIGLLGVTREPDTPPDQCYLEFLWVSPEYRRSNVATRMLTTVLDRLKKGGVRTAFLWVLDGNDAAVRLYKKIGFVSTNYIQPLLAHPGRSEERMQIDLNCC
jgi:ribosomal protein S18 acetylase RimI-like enzyme